MDLNFYSPVKSTIDKLAHDLATQLNIGAVELDDVTNVEDELASPDDMVLFQFVDLVPNPFDPMYDLEFQLGIKTTGDSGNYDLAGFMDKVQNKVQVDDTIQIRDYSQVEAPDTDVGYIYVTATSFDPQAFDGAAGVRMQAVQARVVRYL